MTTAGTSDSPLREDAGRFTVTQWRLAAVGLAFVVLVVAVLNARGMYFVYDEWYYWTFRRGLLDSGGKADLVNFFLAPHNGHLQALVWLVWLPVDAVVGMKAYLPYLIPAVAFHALAGWLLFELLLERVRPAVAFGFAALYLVMGNAAAATSFAFTLGETAPIAATFFGLLAVERWGGRSDRLMLWSTMGAVCVAMAAASGIGLMVLGVISLAYVLHRRFRLAALHLAVFVGGYLVWWSQYETPNVSISLGRLGDYLTYTWHGLAATGADLVQAGGDIAGIILLALTLGAVVWSWRASDSFASAASAAFAGAVAYYGLVAIRGIDLNPLSYSPDQGRYLYVAGALMLPALAWLADRAAYWRREAAIGLVLVALWALPANAEHHLRWNDGALLTGEGNRATIEVAASIVESLGEAPDGVLVFDGSARIQAAQLARLSDQGKLPCRVDIEAAQALALESGVPAPRPDEVACP